MTEGLDSDSYFIMRDGLPTKLDFGLPTKLDLFLFVT